MSGSELGLSLESGAGTHLNNLRCYCRPRGIRPNALQSLSDIVITLGPGAKYPKVISPICVQAEY